MRKNILTTLITASLLGLATHGSAVGVAAGTSISNTGFMDLSDGVATTTVNSTPVIVNVTQVYNVNVTPDSSIDGGGVVTPGQNVSVFPGQTGTLTYTVTNTGNGTDSINLSAVTSNTTAQTANIIGIFADSNGNGSYDSGDAPVTSATSLTADQNLTVFVRYEVPAGTTGQSAEGAAHQINLRATSTGNATVTDTNNIGQVTVGRVTDLNLVTDLSQSAQIIAVNTFTHTLTNTGNSPLSASDLSASVIRSAQDAASATITDTFSVSYRVTSPSGTATNTSLEDAINAALVSPLASGGVLTIEALVTASNTAANGDQLNLTLIVNGTPLVAPTTRNDAAAGDTQNDVVDTATVLRGSGSITKTVASCGDTYTSCPTSGGAGPVNAAPNSYVIYFLQADATAGAGNLYNIRLRDQLPSNFAVTHVGAKSSYAGTLLFSVNGTSWFTTLSDVGSLNSGTTLHVGVDTDADGTITAADIMPSGQNIQVSLAGLVTATPQTYVRDDSRLP